MSEHLARICWKRDGQDHLSGRYSRRHDWQFDGGAVVSASSSPHVVPLPWSDAAAVDPEEAFVAAISSCHMLWFLSLAAKAGWQVDRYTDDAVGVMEPDSQGRLAITRVILRPVTIFLGVPPGGEQLAALHHQAHEACFIANSVRADIICQPQAQTITSDPQG